MTESRTSRQESPDLPFEWFFGGNSLEVGRWRLFKFELAVLGLAAVTSLGGISWIVLQTEQTKEQTRQIQEQTRQTCADIAQKRIEIDITQNRTAEIYKRMGIDYPVKPYPMPKVCDSFLK